MSDDPAVTAELTRGIIDRIAGRSCLLTGCARQRKLTRDDRPTTWRTVRGDAVLRCLGTRTQIDTEVGPFDAFIAAVANGELMLVFRAGREQPWWQEDIEVQMACAQLAGATITGTLLIQELDSELTFRYFDCLDLTKARTLVDAATERFNTTARIAKNGARGRGQCPHCPVKAKCDFIDLSKGENLDWPKGYVPG